MSLPTANPAKHKSAPWGWEESTDPEGNTIWVSKMGTLMYKMPEFPVYCTKEKVQEWVKFYDTRNSQYYYANSFTGEHTFDIPPLYNKQLKDKLPIPQFQTSALKIQCIIRIRFTVDGLMNARCCRSYSQAAIRERSRSSGKLTQNKSPLRY